MRGFEPTYDEKNKPVEWESEDGEKRSDSWANSLGKMDFMLYNNINLY